MVVKELITITEAAAEKLKSILEEQKEKGAVLRVLVMPGGHGGLQYMLALEKEAREEDLVIETDSIRVIIDAESAPLIEGASIDYVEGLMRSGFVISNPNFASGGGCACGGNCSCGGSH
ncbi:MAG: iron-sulfur cluster assembly accessory protein [Chloroflexi bacterium]|nr:iron-sulfur cluster assembly accessory protein [Chloroflexota bacterium]